MRLGVCILPEARWAEARPRWEQAEQLGFEHAWTYDHLSWRSFHDHPWYGAVPTLSAAAAVTERIRLGPLVASPNFRHPVPFAKELLTLDDISGGRLILGIGAGGVGWDATVLGQEAWTQRERTERFEEFTALTHQLLSQPVTTAAGVYYSADDARMIPPSVQQPRIPMAVAATGPRGLRAAATYGDTWVSVGPLGTEEPLSPADSAALVAEQIQRLEEACHEVGRDPASIGRLALTGAVLQAPYGSPDEFDDAVGRYAEAGVTDLVVHWPRPEGIYAGDLGAFERTFSR